MNYLLILNDPPYGSERTYNGFRTAGSLAAAGGQEVSIFLIGDAAACGLAGQTTPSGYYNIERMLKGLVHKGVRIGICGSCMDARGIKVEFLIEGTKRSSLEELTEWTMQADHVLVF